MGTSGIVILVLSVTLLGLAVVWLFSKFEIVLKVPLDSNVNIDGPVAISLTVPFETVLTENEIDLNQLEIPIDTDVFIDDAIDIDTMVPIATQVTTALGINVPVKANIPLKARIPIRQKVHVKDRVKLNLKELRIPIKTAVPVSLNFVLKQVFRVTTTIDVPLAMKRGAFSIRGRSKDVAVKVPAPGSE